MVTTKIQGEIHMRCVQIDHGTLWSKAAVGFFAVALLYAAITATVVWGQSDIQKDERPAQEMTQPDTRASELVGRNVLNRKGDPIAEIDDLIIDPQGCIESVILAVGGFLGIDEKLVAVDFSDLQFETQWSYRTIRTMDGTEHKLPWESRQAVIFKGGADTLRSKPAYAYKEEHPRGGASG
jgi:sporulation protein YlmC with PRC-barrel domain